MNIYFHLTLTLYILFMFIYLYICFNVFYILYSDDFMDIQTDIDKKLNDTHNNSFIVPNAIINAFIQNI